MYVISEYLAWVAIAALLGAISFTISVGALAGQEAARRLESVSRQIAGHTIKAWAERIDQGRPAADQNPQEAH